jgi:hypothetical protein
MQKVGFRVVVSFAARANSSLATLCILESTLSHSVVPSVNQFTSTFCSFEEGFFLG